MKVLLLKDVYKLGRAGEVKKVAAGYGRNYLIPQGLATIATKGAIKMADRIKETADKQRAVLNEEMSGVAEQIEGMILRFPARASETGRLYGSINTRMLAETISEEIGIEIKHTQIDSQPLRMIGEHTVNVRLTVDLIPEIKVVVFREGEVVEGTEAEEPEVIMEGEEEAAEVEAEAETGSETEIETEVEAEVEIEEIEAQAEPAEAVVDESEAEEAPEEEETVEQG